MLKFTAYSINFTVSEIKENSYDVVKNSTNGLPSIVWIVTAGAQLISDALSNAHWIPLCQVGFKECVGGLFSVVVLLWILLCTCKHLV